VEGRDDVRYCQVDEEVVSEDDDSADIDVAEVVRLRRRSR